MLYEKISGFSDEIAPEIITQFEVLNKLGIKYFEPRGVNGKNISELTDEEVYELKAQMEKYGIAVSSVGSPVGKIKISDDFEQHIPVVRRTAQIAKMLDCKYVRMFSFFADGEEWTKEQRDEVFRRMKIMVDIAKEEDVIFLHENEKEIYGDIADRCLEILQEFACDNFKAVFDPANFVQCGEDTKRAYELLKDYVVYMHIKDALYVDESVVPAGKGDGNVEYVIRQLFANGYEGFLSLEPHLGSFMGLEDLELDDGMMSLPKSGEGTFTVAYNALKEILNKF